MILLYVAIKFGRGVCMAAMFAAWLLAEQTLRSYKNN